MKTVLLALCVGAIAAGSPASAQTIGTSAWTQAGINDDSSPANQRDGSRSLTASTASSAQSSFSTAPVVASASAYADLTTGRMGVFGSSNYATLNGQPAATRSEAQIADRLVFTVAGAGANDITPITVTFGLDGGFAGRTNYGTASVQNSLFMNSAGAYLYNVANNNIPAGFQLSASNWQSYSVASDASGALFTGIFALQGASMAVDINMVMRSTTYAESIADFSHTSTVRFVLPTNVTFTSSSNAFLTNVTAVPESATWAMLVLGFGMVGFALRSRRMGSSAALG